MKTYTWPEAWDLMVNHGKIMTPTPLEGLKQEVKFDKKSCLFVFIHNNSVLYLSESNCEREWVIYEEPKKFELYYWNTLSAPLIDKLVVINYTTESFEEKKEYYGVAKFNKDFVSHYLIEGNFPSDDKFVSIRDVIRWKYLNI